MKKISYLSTNKVFTSNSKKFQCNVNNASNEIMLNRIFNGNRFEFPFSNYLNWKDFIIFFLRFTILKK